jgi:hypothetical protein
VLTATGIGFEHPVSSMGVRWQDVEELSLFTQNDVVNIGVDAPRELVVQRTGSRLLSRTNRMLSGTALAIPTMALGADPDRLFAALEQYLEDPSPLRDPQREREALLGRLRPVVASRTAR